MAEKHDRFARSQGANRRGASAGVVAPSEPAPPVVAPADPASLGSRRSPRRRRQRRQLIGAVSLIVLFLVSVVGAVRLVLDGSDLQGVSADRSSSQDGGAPAGPAEADDELELAGRAVLDAPDRIGADDRPTTLGSSAPGSPVDGDRSSPSDTTTSARVGRGATTTTRPGPTPSQTTEVGGPNAPPTSQPATTTTTSTPASTDGAPTPVAVVVRTDDGSPIAGLTVKFKLGNPPPPEASPQNVVTDAEGWADLTVPSGCWVIELDKAHQPKLVDQPAKRRCFRPLEVRHEVAFTAAFVQRPPPSSCSLRRQESGDWLLTIGQDSGQWAIRYVVRGVGSPSVQVRRRNEPIESTETSRTFLFQPSTPLFQRGEDLSLFAVHSSGNSSSIACPRR